MSPKCQQKLTDDNGLVNDPCHVTIEVIFVRFSNTLPALNTSYSLLIEKYGLLIETITNYLRRHLLSSKVFHWLIQDFQKHMPKLFHYYNLGTDHRKTDGFSNIIGPINHVITT